VLRTCGFVRAETQTLVQRASHGAPNPSREASQRGALSLGICGKGSQLAAVMAFAQKSSEVCSRAGLSYRRGVSS